MKKKYFPIDIEKLFNHKMMSQCPDVDRSNNDIGVMGTVITDQRYNFTHKQIYIKGIRFNLSGNQADYDNFISNGQMISLPINNEYKRLAIIGFNEFYSYKNTIKITKKGEVKDCSVMFYHMNENISVLFKNETTEQSFKVLGNKSNAWQKVNYFCDVIDIEGDIDGIIFPENIETHIVAITAIK